MSSPLSASMHPLRQQHSSTLSAVPGAQERDCCRFGHEQVSHVNVPTQFFLENQSVAVPDQPETNHLLFHFFNYYYYLSLFLCFSFFSSFNYLIASNVIFSVAVTFVTIIH